MLPIEQSGMPSFKVNNELLRYTALGISTKLTAARDRSPHQDHVLLSNFMLGSGFIGATISEDLSVPHVAIAAGTDINRGLYVPSERSTLEYVLQNASVAVALNETHRRQLSRLGQLESVVCMRPSVEKEAMRLHWARDRERSIISLFSDCGYSSKKGTHALSRAVDILRSRGHKILLTICGGVEEAEKKFWQGWKAERYRAGMNEFLGFIPKDRVWELMATCDWYCSASLGEGCSNARTTAMCIGVPMVTTNTGEIVDLVTAGNDHIFVVQPGNFEDLLSGLERACRATVSDEIYVKEDFVANIRSCFDSDREALKWKEILQAAFAKPSDKLPRAGI
ncbi:MULTISPECIES: glycosyltransferase [unclassified Bosea (in: a-proteobacteria)]|uniref:glycosyltransferase n=1 Tax=unclassified Bosea (in: a-proteobacteria) TaxID=2653178 RepID=UPI001357B66D|nr:MULTISPECIES: glycosyltransferase [unclassified Bosea (in: a-proteobacteria)]